MTERESEEDLGPQPYNDYENIEYPTFNETENIPESEKNDYDECDSVDTEGAADIEGNVNLIIISN